MQHLEQQEWLITNGNGGFASGTVSDARTRTYHGWLTAALQPPGDRKLLLSHLEATLQVGEQITKLGTNFWTDGAIAPRGFRYLQSFQIEPVPTWVWQKHDWSLKRQLFMPHVSLGESLQQQRLLIKYTYQGNTPATLMLRPLIADRNFHHQQIANFNYNFRQYPQDQQVYFQLTSPFQGTPWLLRWSKGDYQANNYWYWNYFYPEEQARGLGDREDLYNPGLLIISLDPGDSIILEARLGGIDTLLPALQPEDFTQALKQEQSRRQQLVTAAKLAPKSLIPELVSSSDQFIVSRLSTGSPTVIAGYPWFDDWGRDTLIALPGLTLTTGRFEIAKGLLQTMSHYCRDGLIPNTFPEGQNEPIYNSLDASLWWIETLGLYLEATQDWDFLQEQYPIVRKIYKALAGGTKFNIRVDAIDGLLIWNDPQVAITWMDALIEGEPVTPRCGKCIEINALWYSALCWAQQWAKALELPQQVEVYAQTAQRVKQSLQKFWNHHQGYFYDVITPEDQLDAHLRPNAVLALALRHCAFSPDQGRTALQTAHDRLLTPYGLRTLDPSDPSYIGTYTGNSRERDRAYHQGTVWVWLLGSFLRAWRRFYPDEELNFDWQPLLKHYQQEAGLGSISEIFDGDFPHQPRGAIAQAWSIAEVLREYSQL
jgi:predicted glycogen debranching enzyme